MDIPDHPLGGTATPIWGDPRVPEEYEYISSYPRSDTPKPAAIPASLALAKPADDRVCLPTR